MRRSSEAIGDQLHAGVDQVADKDARSEDFSIGTLLLVQVPRSTDSQEVTGVSCAVDDDHHDVDDLREGTR